MHFLSFLQRADLEVYIKLAAKILHVANGKQLPKQSNHPVWKKKDIPKCLNVWKKAR